MLIYRVRLGWTGKTMALAHDTDLVALGLLIMISSQIFLARPFH